MNRSKARVIEGHSHPITGLSWSRDQRKLLSSSMDNKVILWDVEGGGILHTYDAGEVILSSQLHPRDDSICAISLPNRVPEFVNLTNGQVKPVPSAEKGSVATVGAIAFSRDGSLFYWGDCAGKIHEVDVATWKETRVTSVGSDSVAIRQLVLNHKSTFILANCSDRKIRLYQLDLMECTRSFVDPVKKNMWKSCCFSNDSDFVVAGSADKAEHHIYIWDRAHGNLVKNIEGPK